MIQRLRSSTILTISLAGGLLLALLFCLRFEGETRTYYLSYNTPIAVPFIAFVLERAQTWREASLTQKAVDLFAVIFALLRAGIPIPLISGHTLFLSYAILTSKMQVVQITAILIFLQVTYLKLFIWHDVTIWGGLVLGGLSAWQFRRNAPLLQTDDG